MGFSVYQSDAAKTSKAGFGRVADVPCIFDTRPGYHRLGNQYLIDRALNVWDPVSNGKNPGPPPGKQALINYAYWLANFLEWAHVRSIDILKCEYTMHVYERYQHEMSQGSWSRYGNPLQSSTINHRVDQACAFLSWLAFKGYRDIFEIPIYKKTVRIGNATSSVAHRGKEVSVRKGKARVNKKYLRIPTDNEIQDWLGRVYKLQGITSGLMCETVLLTAMRRQEVACLRFDFLPENKNHWHINNFDAPKSEQSVLLTIRYGTKGTDYGTNHSDKVGPERSIWIPLTLAERLHDYRARNRSLALKSYVAKGISVADKRRRISESVHLFLNEKTGARIKAKALYDAWTNVDLPFKGWSPHLGRDWWACSVRLRKSKRRNGCIETICDSRAR
jgi:hypothetical protein